MLGKYVERSMSSVLERLSRVEKALGLSNEEHAGPKGAWAAPSVGNVAARVDAVEGAAANAEYSTGATITSDSRIKSNIAAASTSAAYDTVSAVVMHSYTYNRASASHTRWGFIAQQVEEVVPEAASVRDRPPRETRLITLRRSVT